jgi:hypothetical protein
MASERQETQDFNGRTYMEEEHLGDLSVRCGEY